MKEIVFKPIGIIRSPFTEVEGTPIQPVGAKGVKGTVELLSEYAEGLKDIEGFSHIYLIYHLHLSGRASLTVKPFLDNVMHGIFATRSPARPNPIGLSIVRLAGIEGDVLHIEDVDIIDGTPLLDIKPYVPDFDNRDPVKTGWFKGKSVNARDFKADARFKH